MFCGNVWSTCCTVASRAYFSGHSTKIEYIGGRRLSPGESARVVLSEPAERAGSASAVERREVVGRASLIGGVPGIDMSCTYDEADERSERKLLVRAADLTDVTDGSELAEDTEATSGDVYGDGDWLYSRAILGDALAWPSLCIWIDEALDGLEAVVGLGTGPGDIGRIGMVITPGVVAGGGWSRCDGNVVLM